MSWTILQVAYPFAPVGPDAVGGAEQVLSLLDRALTAAGHTSLVIATEGSAVAGTLLPVPAETGRLDDAVKARGRAQHRATIEAALQAWPVDLVHLHGLDFWAYRPAGVPMLATLHLPPGWYPEEAWRPDPHLFLNPVSGAQARACPPGARLLEPIANGVPVEALAAEPDRAREDFCLVLGRICPEKGIHLALEAARLAGVTLLVGGAVFPYAEHERYFAEEVRPRLDAHRRFLGPLGFAQKRDLLSRAKALLVPSLAPETSSLVAMEALACGTPVIAFPAGALPEIVEPGETGFLVDGVEAMARAIGRADEIDRRHCRRVARERFSGGRMAQGYFAAYRAILDRVAGRREPVGVLP
ncbi:glycosyltransferase family 4 protein [Prosthecomicrobium sp. N25]|uniref:glycosyltransferase family 4 protein n=1 Tax=Prosthecomicrobium sp. N25 TaxID=3129254 RepID=UPI003077A045